MTEGRYITNAEWRRQRTRLTRAVNSGQPIPVLVAVEKTLVEWDGKAWPDDWSRFRRAIEDSYYQYLRLETMDTAIIARFTSTGRTLA